MSEKATETKPAVQAQGEAALGAGPARRDDRMSPSNHVYIGKKPVMSYAMSALISLSQNDEVILMARGMVTSRAVDVAEMLTKRLGNNAYQVKNIAIDTERMGEGEMIRNVSTIAITIAKK